MAEEAEIEAAAEAAELGHPAEVGVAAALDEARANPVLHPEVEAFFKAQTRLADHQRHHADSQFKLEHRAKGWDVWSKRLKVLLQAMTALVAGAVLTGVGVMAWDAHEDHGLVINALSTPQGFAERGAGGEALAGRLQDKLAEMESRTASASAGARVRAAEKQEIKVEIPETGISLGEVQKLLQSWLSHRTIISGAVSKEGETGLAMDVRVGEEAGQHIGRADDDLEALLQTAAEHIYEQISPLRYAQWLEQHGRAEEARGILRRILQTGSRRDAAKAATGLAATGDDTERRNWLELAINLDPSYATPYNNLAVREPNREKAAIGYRKTIDLSERSQDPDSGGLTDLARSNLAGATRDFADSTVRYCRQYRTQPCDSALATQMALRTQAANAGVDSLAAVRLPLIANALGLRHDPQDGRRLLAAPQPDLSQRSEGVQAQYASARALAALSLDCRAQAWGAVLGDIAALPPATSDDYSREVLVTPCQVEALINLGRAGEAGQVLAAKPLDNPDDLMARAMLQDAIGDHRGADSWYAKAVQAGPHLPDADTRWSRALLARRDIDGAIAKAKASVKIQPNYADAHEALGEAFAAKGDLSRAATSYADAAKLAPYWGRVRLKWAEALARAGKADKARAQAQLVRTLELTPGEQAELRNLKL